jgi:hypothetical protein
VHSKRCSFHERSKSIVMNYSVEGARILSGGSPDLRAGWQSLRYSWISGNVPFVGCAGGDADSQSQARAR